MKRIEVDKFVGIAISLLSIAISIFFILKLSYDNKSNGYTFECNLNECPTNIFTGIKKCPASSEKAKYDPGIEVCNSKFSCDNLITPFAELSDGSTSDNSLCESGTGCNCFQSKKCSNYINVKFNQQNGNILNSTHNQNIKINQSTSYYNQLGKLINEPPMYVEKETELCRIPIRWVDRLWPTNCSAGHLAIIDFDGTFTPGGPTGTELCDSEIACVYGNPTVNAKDDTSIGIYNAKTNSFSYSIDPDNQNILDIKNIINYCNAF